MAYIEKRTFKSCETTSYSLIQQLINCNDLNQLFTWLLDTTNDVSVVGTPGYLTFLVPPHLSKMAHCICCKNVYKGERKMRKALLRLIKMMMHYPKMLELTVQTCHEILN